MTLSIVVRVVGGRPFLDRCLEALVPQAAVPGVEVIVPHDAAADLAPLAARYPGVDFVHAIQPDKGSRQTITDHETWDRQTAVGLRRARGAIVAVIEDSAIPAANWVAEVIGAHARLPKVAIIGGAVEPAGRDRRSLAVYFLDFGRYGLPLADGPAASATDVNVSYKRQALESVRPVWQARYNEYLVHSALLRAGATLWLAPAVVVHQDRGAPNWRQAAGERFRWARLFAAVRGRDRSLAVRVVLAAGTPLLPLVFLSRIARRAAWRSGVRAKFAAAAPSIVVMGTCWAAGEWLGYVTGRDA
jgi:hypothetical protein